MPQFIMMVGLPGSGKSTLAIELKNADMQNAPIIFSSDAYRLSVLGSEEDQSDNAKVFNALYKDMIDAINNNVDVIFDATNITLKDRQKCFNRLSIIKNFKNYTKEAYVVCTPFDTCVERDVGRERKVGRDVILKMLYKFQCPMHFEGFDQIHLDNNKQEFSLEKFSLLFQELNHFDQKNHHHTKTLGDHCRAVAEQYKHFEDKTLFNAGMVHDVGKIFTQTFDEKGEAHYHNHANVGAYFLCCKPELVPRKEGEDILPVIFYVNYHMQMFDILKGNEKTQEKYKNLFGKWLFATLKGFNEADISAS